MTNIYNYTLQELEDHFVKIGEPKFKAKQVYEWIYKKKINAYEDMRNVSKFTIAHLKETFPMKHLTILEKQEDVDVCKYLFELEDHNQIEAVLMKHDYGNSLCVSSQVGCNMGCTFCESGRLKKVRNLEAYEMVLQILQIEEDLHLSITHIVLMGIGEPFDNYDNVMKFIDIINEPKGIGLGARHITVSTCGIIPKLEAFMNHGKQVNLAISLHAPNDSLRTKLMPVNKVYPIGALLESLKKYIEKTGRRVTFEYILLDGINDTVAHADALARLLKGINCYVNLIPYNETSHIDFKKSAKYKIMQFYDCLKKKQINVTIRKEFGSKVSAACGQLRANYEEEK